MGFGCQRSPGAPPQVCLGIDVLPHVPGLCVGALLLTARPRATHACIPLWGSAVATIHVCSLLCVAVCARAASCSVWAFGSSRCMQSWHPFAGMPGPRRDAPRSRSPRGRLGALLDYGVRARGTCVQCYLHLPLTSACIQFGVRLGFGLGFVCRCGGLLCLADLLAVLLQGLPEVRTVPVWASSSSTELAKGSGP